jgi:hypothetical protein
MNLLFHALEMTVFLHKGFKGGTFLQTGLIAGIILDYLRLGNRLGQFAIAV